jgi:mono/diheme cytochrome c family protein
MTISTGRSVLVICACVLLLSCETLPETGNEVSYGRQIAPIFALHCNGCHSDENPSSGFRTGSYRGLMHGGTIGDDIVPGKPDSSILVQLIEGVRGPEQQMPNGARPLHSSQIQLIRNWIAEGAKNDGASTPCYYLSSRAVFPAGPARLNISVRIPIAGVIELLLKEQPDEKFLFRREASIKPAPERMDAGAPDHWVTWTIGRERGWPGNVKVELRIRYTEQTPTGAFLRIGNENKPAALLNNLLVSTCLAP